jgi:hypothetical protein
MMKFQWRPTVSDAPAAPSLASEQPDLTIRSLLDDPALRRSMGLDVVVAPVSLVVTPLRPQPVFNRRRLLEGAAA